MVNSNVPRYIMKVAVFICGRSARNTKLSTVTNIQKGGEEIPAGGWRGGEEVPAGGWRGGEEIPKGGWRGGEEIPKGGWRAPSSSPFSEQIPSGKWLAHVAKDVYRTKDGRAYFEFGFAQVGSRVEIDILDSPSYGGRTEDVHTTHRLKSERGGYKICFGDPSISNDISSAKKWAAMWAELTWKYITTGQTFPNN